MGWKDRFRLPVRAPVNLWLLGCLLAVGAVRVKAGGDKTWVHFRCWTLSIDNPLTFISKCTKDIHEFKLFFIQKHIWFYYWWIISRLFLNRDVNQFFTWEIFSNQIYSMNQRSYGDGGHDSQVGVLLDLLPVQVFYYIVWAYVALAEVFVGTNLFIEKIIRYFTFLFYS